MITRGHTPFLLDVLEELPLDVVEDNLWNTLPPEQHRHLRQACQRSRRLADDLITSATCDFRCGAAQADCTFRHDVPAIGDDEEEGGDAGADVGDAEGTARAAGAAAADAPGDGEAAAGADVSHTMPTEVVGEDAWPAAAKHWTAFLTRLPRLTSLELQDWGQEADLEAAMLAFGTATQSRVTSLALSGDLLSASGGGAMGQAFPSMQELTLRSSPRGRDPRYSQLRLEGAVFRTLRPSTLTKLSLHGVVIVTDAAFSSLRALTALRFLDMSASFDSYRANSVHHLTALSNLQHLSLAVTDSEDASDYTFRDLAPIFTLTKLTHLGLLDRNDDTLLLSTHAATSTSASSAAAPPSLGDLVNLQSLVFGGYVLRDAAFAEVRRLTALTTLQVGRIKVAHPMPGHLPALRELRMQGLRPTDLLLSLLPLLPLPSLTSLHSMSHESGFLHLNTSVGRNAWDNAEAQVAALKAIMRHLSAAPHMHLHAVNQLSIAGHLSSGASGASYWGLSMSQVVDGLGVLAGHLTHLVYDALFSLNGIGWSAVGAGFPRLERLDLKNGDASGATLVAMSRGLPALQQLRSFDAVWPHDGWLILAAERSVPLLLVVWPRPEPDMVARFSEVQAQEFGRQNVVWAAMPDVHGVYELL